MFNFIKQWWEDYKLHIKAMDNPIYRNRHELAKLAEEFEKMEKEFDSQDFIKEKEKTT